MPAKPERYLILAKTYPTPSIKYRETTCVAALSEQGALHRLYPIPFRLLTGDQQFARWEWITVKTTRPNDDRRPESRRADVDSLVRLNKQVGTQDGWQARLGLIAPHVVSNWGELERRRQETGASLGILHVSRLTSLEIADADDTAWTDKQLEALQREGLFDSSAARERALLEKLPFTFRYHYEIDTADGVERSCHPITDWEVGQFYRRCRQQHGDTWEPAFRKHIENWMTGRDLYLVMGNIHHLPDQWLIVGIIYPPRPTYPVRQPPLPL